MSQDQSNEDKEPFPDAATWLRGGAPVRAPAPFCDCSCERTVILLQDGLRGAAEIKNGDELRKLACWMIRAAEWLDGDKAEP